MTSNLRPSEFIDNSLAQIRDTIKRLQSPIADLQSLLALLSAPLNCLGLLSPQYARYNISPLEASATQVLRYIPVLQRALLEHIVPTWEPALVENRLYALVEQYFCPDSFSFASPAAGQIVLHAYSVLLSLPLSDFSIQILVQLSKAYPVDVLRRSVFSGSSRMTTSRGSINWEDCVRNVAAVPVKVANLLGARNAPIPAELQYGAYFNNLSIRCERLVHALCQEHTLDDIASIAYLLSKLVNIGVFPPSKPSSQTQASFFQATLPYIRHRICAPNYSEMWSELLVNMSSTLAVNTILASFVSHLSAVEDLDVSERTRSIVVRQALLLRGVFGRLTKERGELWDAVRAVTLGREWSVAHARIFSCWISGAEKDRRDTQALEMMLKHIVILWTNPEHINHSLLKHHQYVTAFLLLTLSYLPSSSAAPGAVNDLALSPPFVTATSAYIGHLDPSIRRCGMLVAEEVARGAGKSLNFGDWEGDKDGRAWCRSLRLLLRQVDSEVAIAEDSDDENEDEAIADPISQPRSPSPKRHFGQPKAETVYDSDDSLTGYASSPRSSRAASPTPSDLDEIEKDPTLRVGQKKVARPVYLAQLGEMIRPTSGMKADGEGGAVTKVEIALNSAEELIRRKRNYGTELGVLNSSECPECSPDSCADENAVNLVYGFIGLQDNYELEGFSQKRQAALNALVACSPRTAAPAAIEELFKNQYSTDQRFAILNALALGARELASLPVPETPASTNEALQRLSFPSKRLPPTLHQKYVAAANSETVLQPVRTLLEGISQMAIGKTKDDATNKSPELLRERQLRIRRPTKVTEVSQTSLEGKKGLGSHLSTTKSTTFTEVAAEFFIHPLINRFWLFLRDEQMREARTAHQGKLHRYKSTGTGLILNAMVLSHFLATLAVLVHAARNAREWLAIIAPDALELAIALGTRPLSRDDDIESGRENGKQAVVLTSSLELVLVVLDGCVDLDGGRTISLEHTTMVLGAGEWAGEVLSQLEKGTKVTGGGGVQEVKLRRAAAGVVLKVDEVTARWRRSIV
ncbi:telomeric DNA binding protein [Cristinia sonorae]|uniref:Telomeric DNA binding protein n=1 Tax=Cristinia sonorae TaxID=1940300 RepID=A0A8K0UYM5_9AGAR|nr:telomeric DNA binding protein [Cristinia sonorae]